MVMNEVGLRLKMFSSVKRSVDGQPATATTSPSLSPNNTHQIQGLSSQLTQQQQQQQQQLGGILTSSTTGIAGSGNNHHQQGFAMQVDNAQQGSGTGGKDVSSLQQEETEATGMHFKDFLRF